MAGVKAILILLTAVAVGTEAKRSIESELLTTSTTFEWNLMKALRFIAFKESIVNVVIAHEDHRALDVRELMDSTQPTYTVYTWDLSHLK